MVSTRQRWSIEHGFVEQGFLLSGIGSLGMLTFIVVIVVVLLSQYGSAQTHTKLSRFAMHRCFSEHGLEKQGFLAIFDIDVVVVCENLVVVVVSVVVVVLVVVVVGTN